MGYEPSDKFGFYACHLSQKTDKVTPGLIGAQIYYDQGRHEFAFQLSKDFSDPDAKIKGSMAIHHKNLDVFGKSLSCKAKFDTLANISLKWQRKLSEHISWANYLSINPLSLFGKQNLESVKFGTRMIIDE